MGGRGGEIRGGGRMGACCCRGGAHTARAKDMGVCCGSGEGVGGGRVEKKVRSYWRMVGTWWGERVAFSGCRGAGKKEKG